MSDTNEHYKLNLIKKAIIEELKKLEGETNLKNLIKKIGVEHQLIEKALKDLESNGYITKTPTSIKLTWASKKIDDTWKPRGVKTTITIRALGQEAKTIAIAIKGIKEVDKTEKPIDKILKTLQKAKTITQKAETQKALHYAQHLTIQAIKQAQKHKTITKAQATKLRQTIKPDKKLILKAIMEIEKQLKQKQQQQ